MPILMSMLKTLETITILINTKYKIKIKLKLKLKEVAILRRYGPKNGVNYCNRIW